MGRLRDRALADPPQVEWLRLLVEGFSGILLWRVFKATAMECLATCRDWPELRRTLRYRFFQRFYSPA